MSVFGLLNINKPPGWSSRKVVDHVQRLRRGVKAGHAGTLDPLATGVLVVCVGPATRLIEYVQRMCKEYEATYLLGRESDSEDVEGSVTELVDPPVPDYDQIVRASGQFLGEIEQRPPIYSALKVQGRRAYQLARAGKQVELAPRRVLIEAMRVLHYAYPELRIQIRCGSGTYVRSLGRDLANSLGTGAVMSRLVRTAVGRFKLGDAVDVDALDDASFDAHLLAPRLATEELPQIRLGDELLEPLRHGRTIQLAESHEGDCAGVDGQGRLVAILRRVTSDEYRPVRSFPVFRSPKNR